VYWTADLQPGVIGIAAGAFNDPDFPDPTHSIWEKSQLRWVTMRPDIPGHIEGRASAKSR
jgi:hypothetical protein